jgi:hypothetical protein
MRAERYTIGQGQMPHPSDADVMHALGFERQLLMPRVDLTAGAAGVWELNRDWQRDVFNLNLTLSARAHW